MKREIAICVLFFMMVMPLASAFAPGGVEKAPLGIVDKINAYVLEQSGISEEYFNTHYKAIDAYYEGDEGRIIGDYLEVTGSEPEGIRVVYVIWKFTLDGYTALVSEGGKDFGFSIQDGEVKEQFRYRYVDRKKVNLPLPKFREITTFLPKTQFDDIMNACGTDFIKWGGNVGELEGKDMVMLSTKYADPNGGIQNNELSLFYDSHGKKDGNDVRLTVNLETGEYTCENGIMIGRSTSGKGTVSTIGSAADNGTASSDGSTTAVPKASVFQQIIDFFKNLFGF